MGQIPTLDRHGLKESIAGLTVGGYTALRDGAKKSLQEVEADFEKRRKYAESSRRR